MTFHLIYIGLAIPLTIWLAVTLFRNGALFLAEVFENRPELASALNHLLVVGFFMLNLGWALLLIREGTAVGPAEGVRELANRFGFLLVTLGFVHFLNLWIFERIRRARRAPQGPPTQPTFVAAGPAGFGQAPPVPGGYGPSGPAPFGPGPG